MKILSDNYYVQHIFDIVGNSCMHSTCCQVGLSFKNFDSMHVHMHVKPNSILCLRTKNSNFYFLRNTGSLVYPNSPFHKLHRGPVLLRIKNFTENLYFP